MSSEDELASLASRLQVIAPDHEAETYQSFAAVLWEAFHRMKGEAEAKAKNDKEPEIAIAKPDL
jgi:hypothetical protein